MPSTPVLVLIALTVVACAFIVALLLKIRSQHIAAQPVFGSYGRQLINADKLRDYSADQQAIVAGSYQPENEAKEEAPK